MKRKMICILCTMVLTASLAGCGSSSKEATTEAVTEAAGNATESTTEAQTEAAESEPVTQIANPWKDGVTPQDVYDLVNAYFIVPDGAEHVLYRTLESQKLAEMQFSLDGLDFVARMKPTDAFEDISGMHCVWTVDEEQKVGPSDGRARRQITDEETSDSLLWRDDVMGIMFSLVTSAKDLDGFDIVGVAERMYQPADSSFMPGSFVEEAAGKNNFESFDELLSFLKKGQGYAYIEIEGFDGKLLAVTDATYDDTEGHQAAMDVTFYGEYDGQICFIGNAFSSGTAYPVRCDGKAIYSAGNHEFQSEIMGEDGRALIVKEYMHVDYDENGKASYSGFIREDNSYESQPVPEDPAEAEKLFGSLFEGLEDKPVIDFTVV